MVQVSWSALSVGFLALYFASSLNQASRNGVEDTDECENLQPIYGGALLRHVYQTLKVPSSIYCLWSMEKFASWTTVQKRQSPNILPTIILNLHEEVQEEVPGWILHVGNTIFFRLVHYLWKKCDVALVWKKALKQGIIERFDKTSTQVRPSSKLNVVWKTSRRENRYKT